MKKLRYNIAFILILSACLARCSNKKSFDSEMWKKKGVDWSMTDIRENMVGDLIKSDTLLHLNKSAVIELLGEPEIINGNTITYLLREKYGSDIDPEYISYLKVEFDTSFSVRKYKIEKKK